MNKGKKFFSLAVFLCVSTFYSGCHLFQSEPKPVVGVLKGGTAEKWNSVLKDRYRVKYVDGSKIRRDLKKIDILLVADAPVDRNMTVEIDKYFKKGGKIIGIGKAGYADGHYNLTRFLRAGKHTFSLAVLYPATLTPDEMVEMSKWSAESGADGISVLCYGTLRYKNVPKDKRKEVLAGKLESEYTKKMKPIIQTEFQQWMKKDSLVPYGMPEVPKMLWTQVWCRLKSTRRPRQEPEELVKYAKEMGFNMICSEEARDGWFFHESKYNVLPDHHSNPADFDYLPRLVKACKKEGIQLWANLYVNGQGGYYWKKHSDQRRIFRGRQDRRICPRAGKAFYDWQLKCVDELLQKFPYISGVSFDESEVSLGCPTCRDAFKKRYGYELSLRKTGELLGEDDENATRFREELNTEWVIKPLINTVRKVNPLLNIGIITPASMFCFRQNGVNLSDCADAGYNVWCFEMPRRYAYRGGRAYLNIETSRTFHTPQNFSFTRLDDLAGTKQIKISGRGIRTDLFKGAVPIYWMDDGKMKFPGIVKSENGKTAYFAFDPMTSDDGKEIFYEILDEMKR